MMKRLLKRVLGSHNDRTLATLSGRVERIGALEPALSILSDDDLQDKTKAFRARLQQGETEDDILEEAFAVMREASKRVLSMRHFDVQVLGGMVLHRGEIAEMKTGEGKTLVATLPVYLNALSGRGVHLVTVNDYLAERDAQWMGEVYRFLGLSVAALLGGMEDPKRQAAYQCDVLYGTNNEFGFDYLRDNLKFSLEDMVQRPFHYAIVDEVDSILIDESRTPLIISGPAEDSSDLYMTINTLIPRLSEADYEKDEKQKVVTLTEEGTEHIERLLKETTSLLGQSGLYDIANMHIVHHVNQALRAHTLFTRDVDYMVRESEVLIIDEFTGRTMEGRRYSDGLHQALEAKEGGKIELENQTLASITFQNYFRLYPTLAGMTGTGMTEAAEFEEIYKLKVVVVPTNKPMIRRDHDDEVYRTSAERDSAVLEQITLCRERRQPVLVGTSSIESSEHFSRLLKKNRIPHHVLNARQHQKEALVIAEAGTPSAVTIATNMAGRGTDIQLGGNFEMQWAGRERSAPKDKHESLKNALREDIAGKREEVIQSGGLYIIGTERHESRRIDNQLRGRSGRQGDPGESKFFVSLSDDLMRIFGSGRMESMLKRLGLKEGEAITHPWVNKAIERAQKKVEANHFEVRKHLLQYDDVVNDQRKVVFEQRKTILKQENVEELVESMRQDVISSLVDNAMPPKALPEEWDMAFLHEELSRLFHLDLPLKVWLKEQSDPEKMRAKIESSVEDALRAKEALYGAEVLRHVETQVVLQTLDQSWKDHLLQLDHLRQGIGLRAYAQKDPLNEYKREAFACFQEMLGHLRENVTHILFHVQIDTLPEAPVAEHKRLGLPQEEKSWGKVPRNAPCPCGSGKKYKHCHGRL